MKKFLNILFFVVVVCVIVISAYYVYKNRVSDSVDTDEVGENLDIENLPEGVDIVETEEATKIVNDIDGYELQLQQNTGSVSYSSGMLKVQQDERQDELLKSSYDIVFYNNEKKTVEEWVKDWLSKQEFSEDYKYSKEKLDNKEFFIIDVPGYASAEKILVYEVGSEVLFIDSIFEDPIVVFENLNLK